MFLAAVLAAAVSIPFTLQANHLVIAITIDGKPAHALFDTGGGDTVDPAFAKTLHLKTRSAGTAAGAGEGTVPLAETRVRTLQFGSITMRDQSFAVLPLARSLTNGNDVGVDAIVGREILNRFVTRIDYDTQTLTFTPFEDFTYAGDGIAVPLALGHGATVVRGEIDGLEGSFQVDTGSSASLILTTPFVDSRDLRTKLHPVGNMIVGRGIGGYTRADLAFGKQLKIGSFTLNDLVLDLSTDTRGAFASHWIDGNLGNDVLCRMTLTIDEHRHMAYIERNSRTGVPTPSNHAGLYAQNDDRSYFSVVGVLANGPAYDAGLRAGDRIVAIDGMPALEVTTDAFWRLLRGPPGEMHRFTIERAGSISTIDVTLRNIV